jgi:hypothetical protein
VNRLFRGHHSLNRASSGFRAEKAIVTKNITEVAKFGQSFIDNVLMKGRSIW